MTFDLKRLRAAYDAITDAHRAMADDLGEALLWLEREERARQDQRRWSMGGGAEIVEPVRFHLLSHLQRQITWSHRTFGPGDRAKGVVAHLRKELLEIEADPTDLKEWIDVVILGLDGAWRSGASPEQIIEALVAKQRRNEERTWPDWRLASPDQPIEHIQEGT